MRGEALQCSFCRFSEASFMVEEERPPTRHGRSMPVTFRFAVCKACLNRYLMRLALDEGFTSIKIERLRA